MKMSLTWHKLGLVNAKEYYTRRLDTCVEALERLFRDLEIHKFHVSQYISASKEGRDGYDVERYKKPEFIKLEQELPFRVRQATESVMHAIKEHYGSVLKGDQ